MSDQEKKELDLLARVFEKFLYGKLLKREGVRAEGLRIVWMDDETPDGSAIICKGENFTKAT